MTGPIPILVYHRIDHERLSTSTSPYVFRRHLLALSRRGWRSLSSDEFAFYALRKANFPARSFVLTFDDGYACMESVVLPILQELNFQAICFASTRTIRDSESIEQDASSETHAYLSWAQAKTLLATGLVDFQSHSHSHRRLHQQTDADLVTDLRTSVDLLSSRLALPRTHFRHLAWPWGDSTPKSRALAERCGFTFQYTVARLAFQHSSSLQIIPRTCYDGAAYADFQIQFWLQNGPLSKPWHMLYSLARTLRRPGPTPKPHPTPGTTSMQRHG